MEALGGIRRLGSDEIALAPIANLATPVDEDAVKALQNRDFFKNYTELTRLAAGGDVEVVPLEIKPLRPRLAAACI